MWILVTDSPRSWVDSTSSASEYSPKSCFRKDRRATNSGVVRGLGLRDAGSPSMSKGTQEFTHWLHKVLGYTHSLCLIHADRGGRKNFIEWKKENVRNPVAWAYLLIIRLSFANRKQLSSSFSWTPQSHWSLCTWYPSHHLIGKDGAKELGCPYSASRRAKKVVNMKCQRSVFQTLGGRWKGRADLMPNNVVKLVASLLHKFQV